MDDAAEHAVAQSPSHTESGDRKLDAVAQSPSHSDDDDESEVGNVYIYIHIYGLLCVCRC